MIWLGVPDGKGRRMAAACVHWLACQHADIASSFTSERERIHAFVSSACSHGLSPSSPRPRWPPLPPMRSARQFEDRDGRLARRGARAPSRQGGWPGYPGAFAVEPDLLLLDEPFVSLDAALAARLREQLVSLVESRAMTTLLATRDLEEAMRLAGRVFLLSARPAHVVAEIPLTTPRRARSEQEIAAMLADISIRINGGSVPCRSS